MMRFFPSTKAPPTLPLTPIIFFSPIHPLFPAAADVGADLLAAGCLKAFHATSLLSLTYMKISSDTPTHVTPPTSSNKEKFFCEGSLKACKRVRKCAVCDKRLKEIKTIMAHLREIWRKLKIFRNLNFGTKPQS
jgi:hypothetical protein